MLRFNNESAASRIQHIRDDIEDALPNLSHRLDDSPDYSESVNREWIDLMREHENEVTDRLIEGVKPPGWFRKIFIYLPLIWFPFIQPLLMRMLDRENAFFSFEGFHDLASDIVSLFGAGALLQCLAFLLLFYGVWLIFLYAHGAKLVLREGQEEFRNTWYEKFLPWINETLSQPIRKIQAQFIEQNSRLNEIESHATERIEPKTSPSI